MSLERIVNSALSVFNLALAKRSTIDTLVRERDILVASAEAQGPVRPCPSLTDVSQFVEEANTRTVRTVVRHQIASQWNVIDAQEKLRAEICSSGAVDCPLCLHRDSSEKFRQLSSHCIFGGGTLHRLECPACCLIFGPEKMLSLTKEQLSEDYEWHYRVYEEGDSTAQEIRAFEALSPRREGIYLNYGSGAWSRSTEQLRERGWNVFAYEPHTAAQSASHGHLIANSAQLSEYRFDGIYSNNVLEHLRHPVQDLRLLRGLLNPGGLMAHATPCFDYLYPFTRFHLFFFVGRSAEELAARAGLRTVRWERDGEFICHVTEAAES